MTADGSTTLADVATKTERLVLKPGKGPIDRCPGRLRGANHGGSSGHESGDVEYAPGGQYG